MPAGFAESDAEEAALGWLESLGYTIRHGPEIAFGVDGGERGDPGYRDTILQNRLHRALTRLNPGLPAAAVFDAYRKLLRVEGPNLIARNRALHRMLVDGVTVEYRAVGRLDRRGAGAGHRFRGARAQRLAGGQPVHRRRGPAHAPAGRRAVRQRPAAGGDRAEEPGRRERDGLERLPAARRPTRRRSRRCSPPTPRWSSPTACRRASARSAPGKEWFKPWRTISGREDAPPQPARAAGGARGRVRAAPLPRPVRHFIVFEDRGRRRSSSKKMAGYHQFHAVNVAVEETLRAAQCRDWRPSEAARAATTPGRSPGGEPGDRRVGVVWHTQGSGKSLTMAFYAGRVILHPAMENPTIVVLTDRNDLDDQLFGTFARCRDLLRQAPVQAADRADLRAKLAVASGGVVFTTIQKFFPEEKGDRHPVLSERRNIVVIADEAHRSQYDFIDGFARHMRDALPQRLVHRLHRHADREDRRQHARRLRRLHQRLRHPARGRRRRDGADLLREPARQAGAEGVRAAEDRPRVRGGDRGRGGRAQGEAQEQVGAARGGGRLGEPASSSIAARPGRALREPARGDGRQGDGRRA